MTRGKAVLFAFLLLSSSILLAADNTTNDFPVAPQQLLQNANGVAAEKAARVANILVERNYEVDANNRVTLKLHRIYRIETQDALEEWSSISAGYAPWHQDKPQIHARVITPDGVEHVLDQKVLTDAPSKDDEQEAVYDDNRVLQAPLPSVSVGAVVETELIIRDKEPLFSAGAHRATTLGSHSGPGERTIVTVRVPKTLPFQYVARLLPKLSVQKIEEGEFVVYRFEQGHLDMLEKVEEYLPGDVPQAPYFAFSTGKSWAEVASAYQSSSEQKVRLADVQELVNKEVKPGSTRDEIIRKLVAVLHKKARYTGVEFAEAALVPAFPAETLKRGYGDCKDKSTLLVAMLRAAGIPAHLALLQSGPGDDTDIELPGMTFDHAIVYVPGTPELWIDATASNYQVGPLPPGDAGRYALIIRDGTDKLQRIPYGKPEDNLLVEKREFFLAEYGPARIVETSLPAGIAEASYRSSYANTEGKELREGLDRYVKSAYLSDKMGKIAHSDAADMTVPFSLSIEVEKGRRGFTDLDDAVAVINHYAIAGRLPEYLRGEDEELTEKEKLEKDKKPRTADFDFTPFITEWQYRIVPPLGFRVRALPESKTEPLGPAKFSISYGIDKDGALLATLRFDTVKGRYTVQEAEALRTAMRQFGKRDLITLGFDNAGHVLVTQGKVAEGLKEYEAVSRQHPKEALHRVQYSSAMFSAGLCEAARTEARKATELDPKSARAFTQLAWVLEHDLVCRRFKKGFDYDGAVAAYRKAITLDPDDAYIRVNLAMLYEHGRDGYQYSPSAQLDDAVHEWAEIKKQKPDVASRYSDNPLFDLMYSSHWKELKEELTNASMNATHRGMSLTADTAVNGSAAALELSRQITSDEPSRSAALATAATYLLRLRRYPDAAELMTAGGKGQADSAAVLQRAELFRHTKRYEDVLLPDSDPRSPVQKMMVTAFKNPDDPALCGLMAKRSMQGMTCDEIIERSHAKLENGLARAQMAKNGIPPAVITDIVLSSMQMTVEGDDRVGYRVTIQPIGAKNSAMYIVKESGHYVVLGAENDMEDICAEVLARLDANDITGARKLLDWMRSDTQVSGGDDPLSGKLFPRLWNRGQEADLDTMRAAALSMIDSRRDAPKWIPDLISARDKAKSDTTRGYMEAALSGTYSVDHNWKEQRESALRLLAIFPTSDFARRALANASNQLKDWSALDKAVQTRLAAVPDDPEAQRQLSDLYAAQGKYQDANKVLKKLIDAGRGNSNDMNLYGWHQLLMGKITDDGIEQVRRGVSLQKGYAIVHTLASIYAEHGNPVEARQLVMSLMDDYGMEEPDSSLWYVFGRIAEAYQQPQAALACYKRVQWKEKFEPDPRTTFALTQKQIAGLSKEVVGAK